MYNSTWIGLLFPWWTSSSSYRSRSQAAELVAQVIVCVFLVLDLVCIYIFSFFHFFFFSFIIILLLSTFLLFTFSLSLSFFPSCLLRRFLFFYSYITGSGNNAHLFRCYLPICQKFKKFKKKIKTQNLIELSKNCPVRNLNLILRQVRILL